MIDLGIFYSKLATVGLIILLGFALGRMKIISKSTNRQITNLLLSIFMPASLFLAFPRKFTPEALGDFALGFFGAFMTTLAVIIFSKLLFPKKTFGPKTPEHRFAFIFNNAGFLGYPLVVALFGPKMLMVYCGFSVIFNISLFTYGAILFQGKISKHDFYKTLSNPNVLAVLAGFLLFILPFEAKFPAFFDDFLNFLAALTIPLSLICVGFLLSGAKISNVLKKPRIFSTCALQLIFSPILVFAVVSILNLPAEVKIMLVLLRSLPVATTLGLFAEKYGRDTSEAGEIVMISTIFSVATLPIVSILLSWIK